MKTLSEVLELVNKAIECNTKKMDVEPRNEDAKWFINYHGHVNELNIRYYPFGWSNEPDVIVETCAVYLTENGIQEGYWFLYNRLK